MPQLKKQSAKQRQSANTVHQKKKRHVALSKREEKRQEVSFESKSDVQNAPPRNAQVKKSYSDALVSGKQARYLNTTSQTGHAETPKVCYRYQANASNGYLYQEEVNEAVSVGCHLLSKFQRDLSLESGDLKDIEYLVYVVQTTRPLRRILVRSPDRFSLPDRLKDRFRPILTTGDGSCFFNALSLQICNSEELAKGLRVLVTQHVIMNENFISRLPAGMGNQILAELEINYHKKILTLLNMENYAELIEIIVLAYLMQANINIYAHCETSEVRIGPTNSSRHFHVFLDMSGQHYTALQPVGDITNVLPQAMTDLPPIGSFECLAPRQTAPSIPRQTTANATRPTAIPEGLHIQVMSQNVAGTSKNAMSGYRIISDSEVEMVVDHLPSTSRRVIVTRSVTKENVRKEAEQRVNDKKRKQQLQQSQTTREQENERHKITEKTRRLRQSPTTRKEHNERHKVAERDRRWKLSPTTREQHNKRHRDGEMNRLQSPRKRKLHQERIIRSQKKRLSDPAKRKSHNDRQRLAQARRLSDEAKLKEHRNRLKRYQGKRLSDPANLAKHRIRLISAQIKRLSDPAKRQVHKERQKLAQVRRLRDAAKLKKHKIRLLKAQTQRLKDPAGRIMHVSRVLASRQRAEDEKELKHRKRLFQSFIQDKRLGPSHSCDSCHRLWFKSSITSRNIASFDKSLITAACGEVEGDTVSLCSTCITALRQKRVPTLSIQKPELQFPVVAKDLLKLSDLEERFVAPRIPFMQIRAATDQQYLVRGRAVNVPITVPTAVSILPRAANESSVVAICFKRKRAFKHNVAFENVRPHVIANAAKVLEHSPLYKHFNITLDLERLHNSDFQLMQNPPGNDNIVEDDEESEEEVEEPVNIEDDNTLLQNALVFAPGEGRKPESLFAEYVEAQAFIKIYGGELIGQPKGISYQQWAKSEIFRDDRRCAHVPKLFFTANKLRISKASSSISFCLRKAKSRSTRFTVNQMLDDNKINDIERHDSGFRMFASDRGSPAFWEEKKKELFAMLRQLGPPSRFLTLSPAETRWLELIAILKKVVDGESITLQQASQLSYPERVRLVKTDPVTVARYFEHRMRKLFNLLTADGSLFRQNKVVESFIRVEFQGRGSPHLHCLLWSKDAPVYKEGSDNREVIEFIDRFVTCSGSLPSEVLDLQTHKHTFTCRKGLKSSGKHCRFDIPFFPVKETVVLTPFAPDDMDKDAVKKLKDVRNKIQRKLLDLHKKKEVQTLEEVLLPFQITYDEYVKVIRSGLKRVTVVLQREPYECMINFYNAELLMLHEANMDIQFITDMYACATYILNYLNKSDNSMSKLLREAAAEIRQGNYSLKEQMRMLTNSFLNASEFGGQQAVFYILGLCLSRCSRKVEFINTSAPEKRVAVLKRKADLEKLPADSTDIFTRNIFDHFIQRPRHLEKTCLADFVAWYNYSGRRKRKAPADEDDEQANSASDGDESEVCVPLLDKSGFIRKRSKAKIIRFVNVSEQDNEYIRENVTLFYPWRNERELISSADAIYKQHEALIKENRAKYVYNESIMQLLKDVQDKELENSDSECDDAGTPENLRILDAAPSQTRSQPDVDIDRIIRGGKRTDVNDGQPDDVVTIPIPRIMPENEYSDLISSLNYQQHRLVLHVLHLVKEGKMPFYHVVLGSAGVGKSRLISSIQQTIMRWLNRGAQLDSVKVLLCAPTGKAAFGIKGVTLHSAFSLPLNQNAGDLKPLTSSTRTSLFSKYQDVSLIIVDEISMVGTKMFHQVDCRLQQIFNSTLPFAGKSVILLGDFNQLAPVCDRYVFEPVSTTPFAPFLGNPLWELFSSFSLTEIMRQKDDHQFAVALNALARGELTPTQIDLFKSRISNHNDIPEGAIRLYRTNADVDSINAQVINRDPLKVTVSADDKVTGQPNDKVRENLLKSAKKALIKDTQIPYLLDLSLNIKYMVTINVNVEDGLVNGAVGILKQIDYAPDQTICRLWLLFPTEVGKQRRQELRHPTNGDLTAIDKVLRSIKPWKSQHSVVRKQFPLVPAEAMTIYKSQGGTYEKVAVSLLRLKRTELYVALSRCTKLNGLYLLGNFNAPAKPAVKDKVVVEMNRLKGNQVKMACLFPASYDSLTICYCNMQSLKNPSHWADFKNFMKQQKPTYFIAAETWTISHDNLDIDGYDVVLRIDCTGMRIAYGLIVYARIEETVRHGYCLVKTFTNEGMGQAFCLGFFTVEYLGHHYAVCTGYKPPTTPFQRVGELLRDYVVLFMTENKQVTVLGDFNINPEHSFFKGLDSLGMRNMLPAGTSTTNDKTCIDCLWASYRHLCGVVETFYSHHKCLVSIPLQHGT